MPPNMIPALLLCALATLAAAAGAASKVLPTDTHPLAGKTYYLSAVRRHTPYITLRALSAAHAGSGAQQAKQPWTASAKEGLLKDEGGLTLAQQRRLAARRSQARAGALPRKAQLDPAMDLAGVDGKGGAAPTAATVARHTPTPTVKLSFEGLTAFEDRFVANGGNQFTNDPPDQGLCVGNGFVMETVNTVLRVFDGASGAPLTKPLALSQFYGLPSRINRTSGAIGPYQTDPSCWYDTDCGRWFHVVETADTDPATGDFLGPTYLDIAVSESGDPTGSWALYRIIASNNGRDGTPNAGCEGGFCMPDYPSMAVWEHALIITTNEYATARFFDPPEWGAANVYAISKHALVRGAAEARTALVRTGGYPGNGGIVLDTLIPATQVGNSDDYEDGPDNSYLMATPTERTSWVNYLQLFRLTGTASLAEKHPEVQLLWVKGRLKLDFEYAAPPPATQRPGVNPQGILLFDNAPVSKLDAQDARMASVAFVNGKLFASWGSAVQVVGADVQTAGVAWAVVDVSDKSPVVLRGGLAGLAGGNSILFPYLAVRPGGAGVLSFSVAGPDYWPSAAYGVFGTKGVPKGWLVAKGQGVLDSFTGYTADGSVGVARFGDYGAGVFVDAKGVFWFASEWVAQTCSVTDYEKDITCGGTRTVSSNWATHITKVTLSEA